MKKLAILALLLLNFLVLPANAVEQKVVIDRLTQSEAEDLDIEIPDEVPPGFHSITIEVYDDNGTVSQKEIEFCKDEEGVVQWDNKCPNLNLDEEPAPVDPEPVKAIKVRLQPNLDRLYRFRVNWCGFFIQIQIRTVVIPLNYTLFILAELNLFLAHCSIVVIDLDSDGVKTWRDFIRNLNIKILGL